MGGCASSPSNGQTVAPVPKKTEDLRNSLGETYSRAVVETDLVAVSSNASVLQGLAKKCNTKLMGIVKANGYGFGAVEVAKHLVENNNMDFFGVATLWEGVQLREGGLPNDVSILVLGPSLPKEWPIYVKYNLHIMINDDEIADRLIDWSNENSESGNVLKAHIMLNTGMSRMGFDVVEEINLGPAATESYRGILAQAAVDVIKRVDDCKTLDIFGLCTHMATADPGAEKQFTLDQFDRFREVFLGASEAGITIPMIHFENTGSLLYDFIPDETVKELLESQGGKTVGYCRSGGGLYGMERHEDLNQEVMTFRTTVRNLHVVEGGDAVGYGRSWIAEEQTLIATLSCGYADGYPRSLSNKGRVYINGQDFEVAGKVCMDMMMVNCGHPEDNPNVKVGDAAILWGKNGPHMLDVKTLAQIGTAALTCLVTERPFRKYIKGYVE